MMLRSKEDNLALKDKQSVPKGRRPLPTLNTNFSNKGNKFTNALGDYARIATFFITSSDKIGFHKSSAFIDMYI